MSDGGHQRIAIAEMPVGRGWADPGRARGLGERETGRPLGADQLQRRGDQHLLEIAVMISAPQIPIASTLITSPVIIAAKPGSFHAPLACAP